MEVKEFQEKLTALLAMAKENDGRLSALQIREVLAGADLDQTQLLSVVKYLASQSVKIEGIDKINAEKGAPDASAQREEQVVPLTPQESAYLKDYLEQLPAMPEQEKREALFALLSQGDAEAQKQLSLAYLRKTAELATQLRTTDVILADLIQEGNLALMQALESASGHSCNEEWLLQEVKKGIRLNLMEQEQQKTADDSLVARVERLDKAVRELSDDEEGGGSAFGINELAIILDMDVEEIRSTLRLTGDE